MAVSLRRAPISGVSEARSDSSSTVSSVTVGVSPPSSRVLDEFSLSAFGYEWDQVEVTPSTWRTLLEEQPVDLLFVESAWHGNHDAWQFHLTGPSAPRPAFVELVQWCRAHGIPTVFWNKEDPAHYADFLDSARLFDHVFTTDSTRIEQYRRDLGHERVDVLPFAAQQSIHNPVRPATGATSRSPARTSPTSTPSAGNSWTSCSARRSR